MREKETPMSKEDFEGLKKVLQDFKEEIESKLKEHSNNCIAILKDESRGLHVELQSKEDINSLTDLAGKGFQFLLDSKLNKIPRWIN